MHADADRYCRNLRGEVDSAALYRMLAFADSSAELAEVYRRLASVEERHAELWRTKLREAGHQVVSDCLAKIAVGGCGQSFVIAADEGRDEALMLGPAEHVGNLDGGVTCVNRLCSAASLGDL